LNLNITQRKHVGFEVLTAVVTKSTISWDITPCSPLSVNRRLGSTRNLPGGKGRPARGADLTAICEPIV
jgi:hypothetical protein